MSYKSRTNSSFVNFENKSSFLEKDNKNWYSGFQDFRLSIFSKILFRKFNKKILISPLVSRTSTFPHQISTCDTVVNNMNGRAILADEVGLGKTIEAGMILTEYLVRKEVKNVLIVVPSGITEQWREELLEKFNIFVPVVDGRVGYSLNEFLGKNSMVITSLAYAKRDGYKDSFIEKNWDMVIVDEAHHLKNTNTMNYKFVNSLKTKKILLLTATPLQNSLTELFNLVNLVSPHAINISEMSKRFSKNFNQNTVNSLKSVLKSLMVRCRRSDVKGVDSLPPRKAKTLGVKLSQEYLDFYEKVSSYAVQGYKKSITNNNASYIFYLMALQRMLTSSKDSFNSSLEKRKNKLLNLRDGLGKANSKDLLELLPVSKKKINSKKIEKQLKDELESIQGLLDFSKNVPDVRKIDVLLEFLNKMFKKDPDSKVLIFTEFLKTQDSIELSLKESGFDVEVYRGGMSTKDKNEIIERFQKGQILISTEAGSEGRNLQFANIVVNYDLPWNPMKIEQRIGRVHRLGQKKEVLIINLIARQTIEDHLMKILDKKLDLFKNTIGELETILGYMSPEGSPESVVMDAFVDSFGKGKKLKKLDFSLDSSIKKVRNSLEESFSKSGINLRPENLNDLSKIRFFEDSDFVENAFIDFLDKYNCLKDSFDNEIRFQVPHFLTEGTSDLFNSDVRGTFSKKVAISRSWLDYLTINHPFLTASISDVVDSPIAFSVFKRSFLKKLGFETFSDKCVAFFSKVRWSYKDESFDDVFLLLSDGKNVSILENFPDEIMWPNEVSARISDDFSLEKFFENLDFISKDIEKRRNDVFSEIIQLEDFRFDNLKNRISDAVSDYKDEFNKIHLKVMNLSKIHNPNDEQKLEIIKLKKSRTNILTKSSKLKQDLRKLKKIRETRDKKAVSSNFEVFGVLKMHIM